MKRIRSFATLLVIVFALALIAATRQPKADGSGQAGQDAVEYSSAKSPSARTLSESVRVGNMLYLSGKLGTNSSGQLVTGGIAPETKQTLENIKAALEKNGSSLDQVVKCTVMLVDMKEWAEMNSVYVTFFKKERLPARSAFGTSGLALNARVEIECLATVKGS
jgi:2-iminobutanoate/2-iminopropanoate deaminase